MVGYGFNLYKTIMRYRYLIILALTALCIVGCENGKKNTEGEGDWYSGRPDSLQYEDSVQYTNVDTVYGQQELYKESEDEEEENAIETTVEVNEKAGKDLVRYKNDVEKEFQKLIGLSPENNGLFLKEKKLWQKYYEAVKTVARIEDNEGSYLLFYYAVLEQAIRLRHESIYNLLQNSQGKRIKFSKTRFTKKMVEESYKSFRESISETNELYYPYDSAFMAGLKESLKEEEKCWNEWMTYRSVVSSKLPENLRSVYDGCTNLTIREKLRQVKNQNQALGVTGDEPWNCILPKDCSDKALLEYPGFDKVWAKHCKDLDWYPTFK